MQGRRVNFGDGTQPQNGDYWPAASPKFAGYWTVITPNGHSGMLNPKLHTITEHEDGTITVSPSLHLIHDGVTKYHGWLERGVWRDA